MPMISLQIDEELQENVDRIQKEKGFSSRSECLREMIVFFMRKNSELLPDAHQIAVITVHYEVREDVATKFGEIILAANDLIKSVAQYHLKSRIIKILLVSGSAAEINDFYTAFSNEKAFKSTISYLVIPEKETK